MGYFQSKPSPPPPVATDKVVPFHFWSSTKILKSFVVEVTLRFDDVLDVDTVRSALERLVNRKGWRKLGARMRETKDGKLEYHIPESYTKDRPGFVLTEEKFNICIDEHPLGQKLPRPPTADKKSPIFVGDPVTFTPITRSASTPKEIESWLYEDIPQLTFHAACFEDATLFTTTWPHTLMDAMGLSAILNAISLILQGREDDIPEFAGDDTDPLIALGAAADGKKFVLYDRMLHTLGSIRFALNMVLEILLYRKLSIRQICVPAAFFESMYTQAKAEVASKTGFKEKPGQQTIPDEVFISESDVLGAWWLRTLFSGLRPRKGSVLTLMNVFDYRSLVTPALLPENSVYVGNGTLAISTLLSTLQVITSPISEVAHIIRTSLNAQRTRDQLEAMAALHRASFRSSGLPAMFGSPDQYLIALSNWHRGKLYQIDFSGALADPTRKTADPLAGKPSYIHPVTFAKGINIRNYGGVSGKDHQGNWWFAWCTDDDTWNHIEKLLAP